jgi:hypothetical protein
MAINPAEIKQLIDDVNFPIAKDDLVNVMMEKGAPDAIVNYVRSLPMDEIKSPGDLFRGLNPMK